MNRGLYTLPGCSATWNAAACAKELEGPQTEVLELVPRVERLVDEEPLRAGWNRRLAGFLDPAGRGRVLGCGQQQLLERLRVGRFERDGFDIDEERQRLPGDLCENVLDEVPVAPLDLVPGNAAGHVDAQPVARQIVRSDVPERRVPDGIGDMVLNRGSRMRSTDALGRSRLRLSSDGDRLARSNCPRWASGHAGRLFDGPAVFVVAGNLAAPPACWRQ